MTRGFFAAFLALAAVFMAAREGSGQEVSVQWFGQACFLITSAGGVKVLMDPFSGLDYREPEASADVVTVSHEHFDHNNVSMAKGSPRVLRGLKGGAWNAVDETVGDVRIYTVPTYHDDSKGSARGLNAIFVLEMDGLKVVHLGDLGHALTEEQVKAVGKPDVLLVPVGGHFTIGAKEAETVVDQLDPAVVIPMHFKTAKTGGLPIRGVEDFLKGKKNVRRIKGNVYAISKGALPAEREIVVLGYE